MPESLRLLSEEVALQVPSLHPVTILMMFIEMITIHNSKINLSKQSEMKYALRFCHAFLYSDKAVKIFVERGTGIPVTKTCQKWPESYLHLFCFNCLV